MTMKVSLIDISTRSVSEPRLSADTTPVTTPISSHSTAAPMAMEKVTGIRSTISSVTGWLSRNE